jgi:hypothetical protein
MGHELFGSLGRAGSLDLQWLNTKRTTNIAGDGMQANRRF